MEANLAGDLLPAGRGAELPRSGTEVIRQITGQAPKAQTSPEWVGVADEGYPL
jgi:hypothetical protein